MFPEYILMWCIWAYTYLVRCVLVLQVTSDIKLVSLYSTTTCVHEFFRVILQHAHSEWNCLLILSTRQSVRTFCQYRGADKSVVRSERKQANVSVRMAWISFGALPCRKKKNLMTARVSMLLKSCASLTFFRTCSTEETSRISGTRAR